MLRCTRVRCSNARAPASAGLLCSVAVCARADVEEALQGLRVRVLQEKDLSEDSLCCSAERSS